MSHPVKFFPGLNFSHEMSHMVLQWTSYFFVGDDIKKVEEKEVRMFPYALPVIPDSRANPIQLTVVAFDFRVSTPLCHISSNPLNLNKFAFCICWNVKQTSSLLHMPTYSQGITY